MPAKRSKAILVRCKAMTPSGQRCKARPHKRGLCFFHFDPLRAAELGRKGGRRRAAFKSEGLKELAAPKNTADLRDLVAQSMIEVRAGEMDPKRGTALAYMGATLLKAFEVSDHDAPRVHPNIYRGLMVVKRVVRPEEIQEKVVQQRLLALQQSAPPQAKNEASELPNDEELAPGVYRY